jgi:hypothetical protein
MFRVEAVDIGWNAASPTLLLKQQSELITVERLSLMAGDIPEIIEIAWPGPLILLLE